MAPGATPIAFEGPRSYVLRSGRTTAAQARALRELWPRYGIERGNGCLDLDGIFGRQAPRVIEIGFGAGDALLAAAAARPQTDFIGVEVYAAGIGRVLRALAREGHANVRVMREDAVGLLAEGLAASSVDEIWLYFPDPWPKKRHHKRRIVQPAFAAAAAAALVPGGVLRVATDWREYAEHISAVLEACDGLRGQRVASGWAERPDARPLTRFEARGTRAGREVFDLAFVRS